MSRVSVVIAAFAILLAACSRTSIEVSPTDRPCADIPRGAALFGSWVEDPSSIPVSFVYGDERHDGLGGLDLISASCNETASEKILQAVFSLDRDVELKVDALFNKEFGETEYTVWVENKGTSPSKELKDIYSAVIPFKGGDAVLRGCLGDHVNKYADYQTPLKDTLVSFVSSNGRATHIVFPYFDLVHGDGGTLLAIGWAASWQAEGSNEGGETR